MKAHYPLFDTLLEPTFILNSEAKVVYCNETAAVVCELSVRKISRGMSFKELFTFSEPIDALDNLNNVKDPTPYKEVNFETSSGQKGKVQITIQPIQNDAGDQHWIVFVRDVTLEERLQKKYRAELEQKEDVILDLQKARAELEQYSKNLEKMVEERTQQISSMNRLMKALLDSLSQGFFIFNKEGLCLEVSSKACENTIETSPAGAMIWDVLKLGEKKTDGFKKWMSTLFMEMLPFDDLAPLGPAEFPHSKGRNISLEYFPLRNEENQIDGVVVVASDITSLVEARKQAENEKHHAKLIINLIRSKNEMGRFIRESQHMLGELRSAITKPQPQWDSEAIFRSLHTLKGGAALFSVHAVAESCHHAETRLTEYKENPSQEHAHRLMSQCQAVELQFTNFLNETKEILGASILSSERMLEISATELNMLLEKLQTIPQAKTMAENALAHLLFEPIKNFFDPYKEVAFRVAEKENKMLRNVEFKNDMIPVVPEIYGPLFATFVHAFRNSVDHGIETPEVRHKAGKPEGGEIFVSFQRQDLPTPTLRISLRDDGGGVDPQKIRAKLASKGIKTDNESDHEVIQHIFDSQFSTKEQVTETSGRGVGMDAIKYEVLQLGGKVWVESTLGKGNTLFIEVPYLTKVPAKKAA
ncbi:ATP-binding protein [Bdellovibrio sp. HCB337]|uniref:ATP-binding protein n=1 Tax=Bdellovibrio sp. HCB337 TaxID=3394358 RepID=UPI0039A623F7